MNDLVTGINEDDLSNLSLEVLDYVDRISEIFDRIDSCMERLPIYYKGASCTALMKAYNELKSYYSIIKENITSYSDDLIQLIVKQKENSKYIANLFREYTEETKNKIKSITS